MENVIIVGLLLAVIAAAAFRAVRHFKGGGCCGSGSNIIRDKKKLTAPKIGEKRMTIEGMHCENCEIRVENALNRLEGAACRVSYKKKTAVVEYSAGIPDETLKRTVEAMGYRVTEIR